MEQLKEASKGVASPLRSRSASPLRSPSASPTESPELDVPALLELMLEYLRRRKELAYDALQVAVRPAGTDAADAPLS